MNEGAAGERLRLFFALPLPLELATTLAAQAASLAGEYGGRPVPVANLHLTLLFLGDLAATDLPALLAAARQAAQAWPRLDLQFGPLAVWPHQQLLWAGLQPAVAELAEFSAVLRSTVEKAGFSVPEAGRPFVPHLTLVRKLARLPAPLPPLQLPAWAATGFELLLSIRTASGAIYRPLGAWPAP